MVIFKKWNNLHKKLKDEIIKKKTKKNNKVKNKLRKEWGTCSKSRWV